jgi:hypothetical protein
LEIGIVSPELKSPIWLLAAALGCTGGALLHLVVAVSGRADWVAYFRAPAAIVQSVRDGGWLGPLSGLAIAALMQLAGCYALSAAGLVRHLPLLRTGLVALAAIGLLRGLIIPLSVLADPVLIARYQTFDWVAAAIWGSIGLCFAVGAVQAILSPGTRPPPPAR